LILKAILVDKEKHLHWRDVPDPVPGDDDVIVDVHAAAVNRADLLQRQGNYPPPPGCPEWMGLEIAGIIKSLSPGAAAKSGWKTGDTVCALLGGGGYAEQAAVRYDMLMPVPRGLTLEEAAALPEVYTTSYLNLFIEGHLEAGQTVFIPAGASGLASAAIPMAKAFGARVITSVLNGEIAAAISDSGADIIIDTSRQKTSEILKAQMEAGRPVNVAMDCLAGQELGDSLPFMAEGGYWILISTLAGVSANIALRPVLTRGLHLVGSMLRKRGGDEKAALLKELVKNVWPKIEAGVIRPKIFAALPVENAEEAHAILEQGRNVGKVVLNIKAAI
jgi:putative PIG3 family NAD(P)H quinone oxidoreductase